MARNDKKNPQNPADQNADLPGYPHYPPEDDIMNPQRGFKKINADEEIANSKSISGRIVGENKIENASDQDQGENDDIKIVRGTEADVTKEDLELLGSRDSDQDMGDDELVHANARVDDVPEEGDLDIPGAELDDSDEALGEEDEENNYYSLGGDRHENLEEDQA